MNALRRIVLEHNIRGLLPHFSEDENYIVEVSKNTDIKSFVEHNIRVSRKYRNPSFFMGKLADEIEEKPFPLETRNILVSLLAQIALSYPVPLLPLNKTIDMLLINNDYTGNAIIFIVNCRQTHYYDNLLELYPKSIEICFYLFWGFYVMATDGYNVYSRVEYLWSRFENHSDFYTKRMSLNMVTQHTIAFYLSHLTLLSMQACYHQYLALMRLYCVNWQKFILNERFEFYKKVLQANNFDIIHLIELTGSRELFFDMLKSNESNAELLLGYLGCLDISVLETHSELFQCLQGQANKIYGMDFVKEALGIGSENE